MTENLTPPTVDTSITLAARIFSMLERAWRGYYTVPEADRSTPEKCSDIFVKTATEMGYDEEIASAINEAAHLVVRKQAELGLLDSPPQQAETL